MRTIIFFQIFLFSTGIAFAKTQILKDYDFNKGGYYLLGVFSGSDHSGLRDTLGEFYTDDISVLNQFKKEWTFTKPSPFYACGYHYTIYICKNGLVVESFEINLNCNMISTNKGFFYFDAQKLRMFVGKLKKPFMKKETFLSITMARNKRADFFKKDGLIMVETPDWVKYEGEFGFIYKYPKKFGNWVDNEQKMLDQLTKEIKIAYPNEAFVLRGVGGSNDELFVNIKCNKTLAYKFKLYPISWNKWSRYSLYLTSYWTKK